MSSLLSNSRSKNGPFGTKRVFAVFPSCQVYTPLELARSMVKAIGARSKDLWLEPCVGEGALLKALAASGVPRARIVGVDLDTKPAPTDKLAITHRGTEFLGWANSTAIRFDKIIANPPYIAIDRLQKPLRSAACKTVLSDSIRVTAAGNTWYAFLCAAINLLKPSGDLCFLLPAAWDYANYAAPLRSNIGELFEAVSVYRSMTPLFHAEGIQDGAVVLVAKGRRPIEDPVSKVCRINRYEFQSASELVEALGTELKSSPARRCNSVSQNAVPRCANIIKSSDTEPLIRRISIGLGGVTGDSKYFLLSDEKRQELGLPRQALRPVLSRAKHLISPVATERIWENLRKSGERVWLFDPRDHVLTHPNVKAYLKLGKAGGACEVGNSKIVARSPWFRTPLPSRVDGFLSGMSKFGPWICLNRMNGLTATNTLYVVSMKGCATHDQRAALALGLLSTSVAEQLALVARHYADGLVKFEPGDLRKIQIRAPSNHRGAAVTYKQAVSELLAGNLDAARRIADDCCMRRG